MEDIKVTLRSLGVAGNYRCYTRTLAAIALILEDENRLFHVVQEVYTVVGLQCGCSWQAVEHSVRIAVGRAWRYNRDELITLSGYPIDEAPTASEFMGVIVNHLQRNRQMSR